MISDFFIALLLICEVFVNRRPVIYQKKCFSTRRPINLYGLKTLLPPPQYTRFDPQSYFFLCSIRIICINSGFS